MKLRKTPYLYILFTLPLWIVAFIIEEVFIADTAAIFGLCVSLYWLWKQLGNQLEMIRLLRIGSMILVALQNGAWLTSSFIFRFSLDNSIGDAFSVMGMSLSFYYLAIIYVTLFSAFLAFLGSSKQIHKPERKIFEFLIRLKDISINKIQVIIVSVAILNIGLIYMGIIGLRTINVDGYEEGTIPAWLVLYKSILPAHIVLCSLFWVKVKDEIFSIRKLQRLGVLVLTISPSLLIFFSEGRKPLVFGLICFTYWTIFFIGKRPYFKKSVIIIVLLFPVLYQITVFFNALRHYDLKTIGDEVSVVEKINAGWAFYQLADNQEKAQNESIQNLSTRPLVAHPLAKSMELAIGDKSFLFGENILNSAIWATPRPLFPNKGAYPVQEALLYEHFPIGSKDTADSVYLYSYVDFGWFGIFFYPMLIFIMWYSVIKLSELLSVEGIVVIIVVSILFKLVVLSIGEGSLVTWFVAIRSVVAWLLFYLMFKIFIPKKIHYNLFE